MNNIIKEACEQISLIKISHSLARFAVPTRRSVPAHVPGPHPSGPQAAAAGWSVGGSEEASVDAFQTPIFSLSAGKGIICAQLQEWQDSGWKEEGKADPPSRKTSHRGIEHRANTTNDQEGVLLGNARLRRGRTLAIRLWGCS